jgi:hypothetical protein
MTQETGISPSCGQKLTIGCVDYFNEKFAALGEQLALRDVNQNMALAKAEKTLDARLEGINEFRAQSTNQAATFVSRDVFDRDLAVITTKIEASNKILYIGLGIMVAIQVLVPILVRVVAVRYP